MLFNFVLICMNNTNTDTDGESGRSTNDWYDERFRRLGELPENSEDWKRFEQESGAEDRRYDIFYHPQELEKIGLKPQDIHGALTEFKLGTRILRVLDDICGNKEEFDDFPIIFLSPKLLEELF